MLHTVRHPCLFKQETLDIDMAQMNQSNVMNKHQNELGQKMQIRVGVLKINVE